MKRLWGIRHLRYWYLSIQLARHLDRCQREVSKPSLFVGGPIDGERRHVGGLNVVQVPFSEMEAFELLAVRNIEPAIYFKDRLYNPIFKDECVEFYRHNQLTLGEALEMLIDNYVPASMLKRSER